MGNILTRILFFASNVCFPAKKFERATGTRSDYSSATNKLQIQHSKALQSTVSLPRNSRGLRARDLIILRQQMHFKFNVRKLYKLKHCFPAKKFERPADTRSDYFSATNAFEIQHSKALQSTVVHYACVQPTQSSSLLRMTDGAAKNSTALLRTPCSCCKATNIEHVLIKIVENYFNLLFSSLAGGKHSYNILSSPKPNLTSGALQPVL